MVESGGQEPHVQRSRTTDVTFLMSSHSRSRNSFGNVRNAKEKRKQPVDDEVFSPDKMAFGHQASRKEEWRGT